MCICQIILSLFKKWQSENGTELAELRNVPVTPEIRAQESDGVSAFIAKSKAKLSPRMYSEPAFNNYAPE